MSEAVIEFSARSKMMQKIKVRQYAGANGILNFDIPTRILEGEVEATVIYQELKDWMAIK